MLGIRTVLLIASSIITTSLVGQVIKDDSTRIYHSIEEGLTEPDKVRVLEVSNISDQDSLELLTRFAHLESLSLIDYHFGSAPASIGKLTGLKELKFINDDFYTIPETYKNLVKLERVEFVYDTHLDLNSAFNFVSELPALVELRIEGLAGPIFPQRVKFPTHLKILSLRNNHLNYLPLGIAQLSELEILDIGNNELLELPNFVAQLPGLNELYLDQQPFLRFDTSLLLLLKKSPTLKKVHLEGNHLSSAIVKTYTNESLFQVFLDEDHAAKSKLYTPHINMNLPPMPQQTTDKIRLIRINN
jgi:Leucine-rich repeat (LRR) protein